MLLDSETYVGQSRPSEAVEYSTVESLIEGVSRKMTATNLLRRTSRGSNCQSKGGSMRVVKSGSNSNSPREATGIMRSRTTANDTSHRRPIIGQAGMVAIGNRMQPQSHRPLSWHPSSWTDAPPAQQAPYPNSTFGDYYTCDFPAGRVYSRQASPNSTYLPPSRSYTDSRNLCSSQPYCEHIFEPDNFFSAHMSPSVYTQDISEQYTPNNFSDIATGSIQPHYDWNQFAAYGFDMPTSPPTPDSFLPMPYHGTAFGTEDVTPYHNDEPDGEELVGLGLYDTPEKAAPLDPQLDKYRSLMMSQLMGPPPPRRVEQTGKGLKLEETWNPPASDEDENEIEEDDDDEDEDEIDDLPQAVNAGTWITADMGYGNQCLVQAGNITHHGIQPAFNGDVYGWP